MILYTSMPLEIVLAGMDDERKPSLEVWTDGVMLQVEPIAPGVGRVVRLLHCSLDDYLNPSYTPGSIINYSKLEE